MAPRHHYFLHKDLPPFPPYVLERVDTPHGRYYELPDGRQFPSVTTILGAAKDQRPLERWRECIGKENANKITTQARNRGNQLHALLENYVNNDPDYDVDTMPSALENFLRIQPRLDHNLTAVYGSEFPVYSDLYDTAGTADLIADWNGVPSILDLKTARKLRDQSYYEGYFIQAAAYALILNEILGDNFFIQQTVVVMLPDDGKPQFWVQNIRDHAIRVYDIFVRDRRRQRRKACELSQDTKTVK
jgi:genome maintenance exonuclease 1